MQEGGETTTELYGVLAVFDKYYDKWYNSVQDSIDWSNCMSENELKKSKMLPRLMKSQGIAVEDVKLKKYGEEGLQHVYVVKGLDKLLGVKGNIREM